MGVEFNGRDTPSLRRKVSQGIVNVYRCEECRRNSYGRGTVWDDVGGQIYWYEKDNVRTVDVYTTMQG